jgi:6-pyruvoyltetrahydropterin/6-carboxytetrahydropterin synthase
MYSVTKTIEFCYGHRLLNYEGKCRYLHGHNGLAEIELSSLRLDQRGMVRDFNDIKQILHRWIDRELDHAMLLHRDDLLLPLLRQRGEQVFVMEENPTAEAIAKLIFDYAVAAQFPVTMVRLWETSRSVATYRPDADPARRRAARPLTRTVRRPRPRARSISTAA